MSLNVDDTALLQAAGKYYGLPLLVLIVCAFVLNLWGLSDLICAAISLSACILCQFWVVIRPHSISKMIWTLTSAEKDRGYEE